MEKKVFVVSLVLLAVLASTQGKYIKDNYLPTDNCATRLTWWRRFDHYDIAHGCSGMTQHPVTRDLYFVHDRNREVYVMDQCGKLKDTIRFSEAHDFECLAWDMTRKRLLVCQEGKRLIHYFYEKSIKARKDDSVLLESDGIIKVDTEAGDYRNGGLEAMCVDPRNGDIYVCNERGPAILFRLDADGKKLGTWWLNFTQDASALAFDETDNTLWLNSDANSQLFKLTLEGLPLVSYNTKFAGEGIVLDNEHKPPLVYLGWDRGDLRGKFDVFIKPSSVCNNCTLAAKDGVPGSKKNHSKFYVPVPKTRCDYDKWVKDEAKAQGLTVEEYEAKWYKPQDPNIPIPNQPPTEIELERVKQIEKDQWDYMYKAPDISDEDDPDIDKKYVRADMKKYPNPCKSDGGKSTTDESTTSKSTTSGDANSDDSDDSTDSTDTTHTSWFTSELPSWWPFDSWETIYWGIGAGVAVLLLLLALIAGCIAICVCIKKRRANDGYELVLPDDTFAA